MSQNLQISNDEILRSIAYVTGTNRTPSNWDATFLTDARDIIRSGLRRWYNPLDAMGMPYQWKFLEHPFYQAGSAGYSTGTIALSAGTVTLTGGTFPTYTEDCVIRAGGQTLYVTSYDEGVSTTTCTVSNDGLELAAGSTYELVRWRYPLPSDYSDLIGEKVVYAQGDNKVRPLRSVLQQEIRTRYAMQSWQSGETYLYSITKGEETTDDDEWYITVWPNMEEAATLILRYRTHPFDRLNSSDLTADGTVVQAPAVHAETVKAAIQAAAEEHFYGQKGKYDGIYQERLHASIQYDRHSQGPVDFGRELTPYDARRLALLYHTPTYDVH